MIIMKHLYVFLLYLGITIGLFAQEINPNEHKLIRSSRPDGKYVSSRGFMQYLLRNTIPTNTFNPNFSKKEMEFWKKKMQNSMKELMKHPDIKYLEEPNKISVTQRNGYRVEKWEAYPFPQCVVPYLVLIPDSLNTEQKVPAVLCFPGTGQSKEYAADEPELEEKFGPKEHKDRYIMAIPFVKKGLIAVIVDNPGAAETSDLEKYAQAPYYNYDHIARILLELNWSYLGYSSYCSMQILNWMKRQKQIDNKKIILCGFSLGTEPMMVLGLMDPTIYAFVFNDFLCRTLERWVVLTEPKKNGQRVLPNELLHLIPGFLTKFDFPDIVAAFAPRPVICPEGGLDRDLNLVKKAYKIMGASQNLEIHHYKKFENVKRADLQKLPEGLNRADYFKLTNVDPLMHDMKMHYIIPWLDRILNR